MKKIALINTITIVFCLYLAQEQNCDGMKITTNKGDIIINLFYDKHSTVANFICLAEGPTPESKKLFMMD